MDTPVERKPPPPPPRPTLSIENSPIPLEFIRIVSSKTEEIYLLIRELAEPQHGSLEEASKYNSVLNTLNGHLNTNVGSSTYSCLVESEYLTIDNHLMTALSLLKIVGFQQASSDVKLQASILLKNMFNKREMLTVEPRSSSNNPNDVNQQALTLFKQELLETYLNCDEKQIHKILVIVIAKTCRKIKLESWKELMAMFKNGEFYLKEHMLLLMLEIIKTLSIQRLPLARKKFFLIISEILPFAFFNQVLEKIIMDERGVLFIGIFKKFFKSAILITPPMVSVCMDMSKVICDAVSSLLASGRHDARILKKLLKLLLILMERTQVQSMQPVQNKVLALLHHWITIGLNEHKNGEKSKLEKKSNITLLWITKHVLESCGQQAKLKETDVISFMMSMACRFLPYNQEELFDFEHNPEEVFSTEMNEAIEYSQYSIRRSAENCFVQGLIWLRVNDSQNLARSLYDALLDNRIEAINSPNFPVTYLDPGARLLCISCFATICFDMKNEQIFSRLNLPQTFSHFSNQAHITKRLIWLIKAVSECSNYSDKDLNECANLIQNFLDGQFPLIVRLEAAHCLLYICVYEPSLTNLQRVFEKEITVFKNFSGFRCFRTFLNVFLNFFEHCPDHKLAVQSSLPITIVDKLFKLIHDCEETSSKIELLAVIRRLSMTCQNIHPNDKVPGTIASQFAVILEPLWEDAGDQMMMKSSLLESVAVILLNSECMVEKYNNENEALSLSSEGIQTGVSKMLFSIFTNEENEPLVDDAMKLWLDFMKHVDTVSGDLGQIQSHVLPNILSTSSEKVQLALEILKDYVVIDCKYINNCIGPMMTLYQEDASDPVLPQLSCEVFEVFALFIQKMNQQTENTGNLENEKLDPQSRTVVLQIMSKAMEYFPGNNCLRDFSIECYSPKCVRSAYTLFARAIMFDPSLFSDVLSRLPELNFRLSEKYFGTTSTLNSNDSDFNSLILTADMISSFIKQWIANFDAICDHKIRKLNAICITKLWEHLGKPEELIGAVFCNMLEILHDLKINHEVDFNSMDSGSKNNVPAASDYLYDEFVKKEQRFENGFGNDKNSNNKVQPKSSQMKRQMALDQVDCVYVVNFVQHVRSVCSDLQATAKKPVDSLVDSSVLDQFNNLKL